MRPACVRWRAPWFHWAACEQLAQSQHGRDGHAPFLLRCKVQFQTHNGSLRVTQNREPSLNCKQLNLCASFDSLRSLLRSCLRQSISLWSVVVNYAAFGLFLTA